MSLMPIAMVCGMVCFVIFERMRSLRLRDSVGGK